MRDIRVAVIGGGITGQLVQFHVPEAVIFDWRDAPLRSREQGLTRDVGTNYLWKPLDGIPCREFDVITTVDGDVPTLERVARYKDKIGKSGDIQGWERQFQSRMPGFDFLRPLSARIEYGHRIETIEPLTRVLRFAKGKDTVRYQHLVSTIPLYSLLSLMGIREPEGRLRFKPIFVKRMARPPDAPYPVDVLYVNYLSNPDIKPYRYCDRFGVRFYESIQPFDGMDVRRLVPGKILPHPDTATTLDMLAEFGVQTFGRYGSWQPDELVHETWDRIIQWKERV